jgi:hypothetical protein
MEEVGMLDIEPAKLSPTWMKKRIFEALIANKLYQFIIYEGFLEEAIRIFQWVTSREDSDHSPVLLKVSLAQEKPYGPFKLNLD